MSLAATNGSASAGWIGLIESGIDQYARLAGVGPETEAWQRICASMLSQGREAGDTSLLIGAASQVSEKLKSIGDQAYTNWLRATVGELQATDASLTNIFRNSAFPVITTNYDTLLEGPDGTSTTWKEADGLRSVLAGQSRSIGHIHGVWTDPDSVVLSNSDYEKHKIAEPIQALQMAIASIKSLVFVGYGQGIDDPNFSSVLSWQRETFRSSTHSHYRLCLVNERDDLERVHRDDNIQVIPYGNQHSELHDFLKAHLATTHDVALTAAGKARDIVAETRTEFDEALKTQAVVIFPNGETDGGEAAIVPPPLLRVPYSQYAELQRQGSAKLGEHLDPAEVATSPGITIVASEEGGGLSTALRWLALEASKSAPDSTPAYLKFSQCRSGRNPVDAALRSYLRERNVISDRKAALPPTVVAIDDVQPYGNHANRALKDVTALDVKQAFIGCRVGDEDDILSVLRAHGKNAAVRYIGRFETKEVAALLSVVAPGQTEHLVDRVVDAFLRTRLPRTPITVASIIFILLHGEGNISTAASQSSILEQYVSLLLGRGDLQEDARLGIEASGREAVLASLAEHLVEKNCTALAEAEVLDRFNDHFRRVGWRESASRLLESLIRRGVLKRSRDMIEFHHNSFVYLFAAKRAATHPDLLEATLKRPLYYSRVIQVYSGLARADQRPVESLLASFSELLSTVGSSRGPTYQPIRRSAPPALNQSVFNADTDGDIDEDFPEPDLDDQERVTPLDYPDEVLPLFADDVDLPRFAELVRALDLLSSVLRDSDQVENLDLKRQALRTVLTGWGNLISAVSHNPSFSEMVGALAAELREDPALAGDDGLEEFIARVVPVLAALSGISFTLKSRTLLAPLDSEMGTESFVEPELVVATALLLLSIGERGWPSKVQDLFRRTPNLSVWVDVFLPELGKHYMADDTIDADRAAAADLYAEIRASQHNFPSTMAASHFRDQIVQQLHQNRLRADTRRRVGGAV